MELENETPFPAAIYRGVIDDDRLFAAVVVRITYDLMGGQMIVADEQVWPVLPGPWECEHGVMAGDSLFYRGGVDLFVLGKARAPRDQATTRVDITVELGDQFKYGIVVFGDRSWQKQGDALVPSAPEPFEAIPLTLTHAFGGKDEWDELPIPYQDNPDGRGYYLTADTAVDQPLPNIEAPDTLVTQWDDRPSPVGLGLCPPGFGPRLRQSVEFDEETGELTHLDPTFFNAAFPDMVAPNAQAGDRLRITGVRPDGAVDVLLPESNLDLQLGFGNQVTRRDLFVDQIGIDTEKSQAFITYRYPFRYKMIPLQKRSCRLGWNGMGAMQ